MIDAADAAHRVLELQRAGDSVAVIQLVAGDRGLVGRRLLQPATAPYTGSLGDAALDAAALSLARSLLARGRVEAGLQVLELPGGASAQVYVEVYHPAAELVIVGAGHIAQPLAEVGGLLGLAVTVLDDRPEFATVERFPTAARVLRIDFSDPFRDTPIRSSSHVVLVTRGHRFDFECLRRLLQADPEPGYIGMIGSRRRVRATFAQLVDEGVARERLGRVRAPVGLDLRAETPAEIAVAVAAEIVLVRRGGGTGAPLTDRERILQRFFKQ